MKKLILILLLGLTSCGPVYYLKHSEKDIKKAIEKGAKIKADTVKQKHRFEIKGAKTQLNFGLNAPLALRDGTRVILKDTVIFKDKIRTEFKDSILYIECPDSVIQKELPVAINNKISAGKSMFEYITGILGGFVFGFIIASIIAFFKKRDITIVNTDTNATN